MIGYLQGTISQKNDKTLILITSGGVGYNVHIAKPLLEKIQPGSNLELFTHMQVRDDDLSLYGFEAEKELTLFKQLLSVNGIGPKTALEILSLPIDKIAQAIYTEDKYTLTKIPGLGKKTADRIILELKSKIEPPETLDQSMPDTHNHKIHEDVLTALLNLGYKKHHIHRVLRNIDPEITKPEDIVRHFLKNV